MKHIIQKIFMSLCMLLGIGVCAQKNASNESMHQQHIYQVMKTEAEWKEQLTPQQFRILRKKGTERPFTGELLNNKAKGVYACAGCGNHLFTSEMKFNSGTGWPSFFDEIEGGKVDKIVDRTLGMVRTEILCSQCGGHLGHVFNDGPAPTGLRYCVNSLSLNFLGENEVLKNDGMTSQIDKITLGGGCFWCTEAIYENLEGVISVKSGYSGGVSKNPTYTEVTSGKSGHAEVVEIEYDKSKIHLNEILEVFFRTHNPTTKNRQGADVGTQYRSVIFFRNKDQESAANAVIETLNKEEFNGKIVTEVAPFTGFYEAEAYHQNYYQNNENQPYCRMVIRPKVRKFEREFKNKLKPTT